MKEKSGDPSREKTSQPGDKQQQHPRRQPTRGHEIGVGSTYYEGQEILGAKPVVPPWEEETTARESFGHSLAPEYDEDRVIGETGGIEEPGGTTGDTTD